MESHRIGQLLTIQVKICIAYPSKGHLRSLEVTDQGRWNYFQVGGQTSFIESKCQNVMLVLLLYFDSAFTMRRSLIQNSTQMVTTVSDAVHISQCLNILRKLMEGPSRRFKIGWASPPKAQSWVGTLPPLPPPPRSRAHANCHLPITFDPKELETWDRCQYAGIGQAKRLICNMTHFGHHVTLA